MDTSTDGPNAASGSGEGLPVPAAGREATAVAASFMNNPPLFNQFPLYPPHNLPTYAAPIAQQHATLPGQPSLLPVNQATVPTTSKQRTEEEER